MKLKTNHIVVILLIIAILLLSIKIISEIFLPFQLEFREGHVYSTTQLLLKGENPYSLEFYPNYYNSYGILYNLIVLPFAYIFGNSFTIHRIINLSFAILSVCVIFKPLNSIKTSNKLFRIIISLSFFALLSCGSISITPNNLGVLLYILSLLIPVKYDFNAKSIILSALFSILAFYTKPYFVLGWIILSIYMFFFRGNKKIIIYNVYYFVLFVFIGFIINKLLPLYFYETIFAYSDSYISIEHSLLQFKDFAFYASPVLLFISLVFLLNIVSKDKFFNLSLSKNPFIYFSLICSLFLLFPLGINQGAYLTYHFMLLLPILSLFVINEDFATVNYLKSNNILLFILTIMLFIPVYYNRPFFARKADTNEWNRAIEYLNDKKDVLNCPIISSIQLKNNRKIYDNGVSVFVFGFKKTTVTNFLFGLDDEIIKKKEQYIQNITTKIQNREFDAIVLNSNSGGDINWWLNKIDTNKYQVKTKFFLKTNANKTNWEVIVFEPNN
jgi:hypothetical protein